MKDLTGRQSEIYNFIFEWQRGHGYPPTQAEICINFKYRSLNAVRSHLALIEKKGYIQLNIGKARGIRLTSLAEPIVQHQENYIPLLGNIAAGVPIWAEHNFEDRLPIPPVLFGNGELFALRIRGDSMMDAGIINGDIAIIQRCDCVDNGEIAAVLVGQDATLKRVYQSCNSIILKSENHAFEDVVFDNEKAEHIKVLGLYRGIVRTMNNRSNS